MTKKPTNRPAERKRVTDLSRFVFAHAVDQDVVVQRDGDKTRIWVEGREVKFGDE